MSKQFAAIICNNMILYELLQATVTYSAFNLIRRRLLKVFLQDIWVPVLFRDDFRTLKVFCKSHMSIVVTSSPHMSLNTA